LVHIFQKVKIISCCFIPWKKIESAFNKCRPRSAFIKSGFVIFLYLPSSVIFIFLNSFTLLIKISGISLSNIEKRLVFKSIKLTNWILWGINESSNYYFIIFLDPTSLNQVKIRLEFLLLIKYVSVLILQQSIFFVEFWELILVIGLSYLSNNVTISMVICVEIIIFS
jgi:hypothetical protein